MQIDLSGKTAIVTGSTAGIGLAIATELLRSGAVVYIVGRTEEKVIDAINVIKENANSEAIEGIVADLSTVEGANKLIQEIPDTDILVNNLGIYPHKPFFEIEDNDWEQIFQINVMSAIRLSRHYAKQMAERGWGRVQFISSESAFNIPTNMVHYGVSKSAIQGLSRGLAKVLAGTGVTVNTILPGPTLTEGAKERMAQRAKDRGVSISKMEEIFFKENRPSTLINRFATPEEVASLCVYAASPQASATTGSALRVEGGIVESIA